MVYQLRLFPESLVVERLESGSTVTLPPGRFSMLMRRGDELTRVRPEGAIVGMGASEAGLVLEAVGGWRAFEIVASFDFEAVGVLAQLAGTLAEAGIPILAFSTWATDVLLVAGERVEAAAAVLEQAGHRVARME